MTMAPDVYDNNNKTGSCEAAVHQEAEAGPSIRNNQTMRGENGWKLAIMMPGTVTMPPSTTTTMATADYAGFDYDNDNVDVVRNGSQQQRRWWRRDRAQRLMTMGTGNDDNNDDSCYNQLARTKRRGQGWTRGLAAQQKVM